MSLIGHHTINIPEIFHVFSVSEFHSKNFILLVTRIFYLATEKKF